MSEEQLVWPHTEDVTKCRRHVKTLYGALRARDIPFVEAYLAGDHNGKDIIEMVHIVRTTYPARALLANWSHARAVLRNKLANGGYHPKVINDVMAGLYSETEATK